MCVRDEDLSNADRSISAKRRERLEWWNTEYSNNNRKQDYLINFYGSIDLENKQPGCKKANSTCRQGQSRATQKSIVRLTGQDEEQKADQHTVAEIKHTTCPAGEAEVLDPVNHGVEKDIDGRRAGGSESTPLPVVVFGTEQEVDHQNSDGSGGDDHQAEADEEEAEHVIHLTEPDAFHDEVELDKDGTER